MYLIFMLYWAHRDYKICKSILQHLAISLSTYIKIDLFMDKRCIRNLYKVIESKMAVDITNSKVT